MKKRMVTTLVIGMGVSMSVMSSTQAEGQEALKKEKKAAPLVVENLSVSESIHTLISGYTEAYKQYLRKLPLAKNSSYRAQIYKERPKPKKTVDQVIAIAKEHPKEEGVVDGLLWCLKWANNDQIKEIGSLMVKHYKDGKPLAKLARVYSRMRVGGEDGLRKIVEVATDKKVKQGATYLLAEKLMKNEKTKEEGLTLMKQLLDSPDVAKNNPRLRARIKGVVYVHEDLSIGHKVPEIKGVDHEGKEFKLSDYKGKVVLLDFWGYW